jgi:hypothetical protein
MILVGVLIVVMGCVSPKMVNMSPENTIPHIPDFETIDATVCVRCSDPLSSTNEDMANALEEEAVFRSVIAIPSGDDVSENNLELLVVPEIIEETFDSDEMVKAVFRGLLLSLADGAFADKYEYTVTLKATMKRGKKILGTYEATGKYSAQQPANKRTAQASEVRKLAWEHVLKLIITKIKEDRKNIVSSLHDK